MKFIIVYHYWFMESKDFEVEILECDNEDEAYKEACVTKNIKQNQFNNCAFKILPITLNEEIANRRLTLWERLSGKLRV